MFAFTLAMTTEYYQIPSQQGFLPLTSGDSADPWLAAATNSLSLADWSTKAKQISSPPSLFEPEDEEASVSWKNVVPLQYSKAEMKSPASIRFNSTTSKIDAWSVVDNSVVVKQQQPKIKQQVKQNKQPQQQQQIKQVKQVKTQPVVEEKPDEELSTQNRYKTELCKSYTETGNCRYGTKCQFAHGKEEIRALLRHPKYKTEICKTFHTTGTCPYGIRCRFIHTRSKEESILAAIPQIEEEEEDVDDDLNAPPGIPVPQWSKSWSMSMAPVASKSARNAVVAAPEPAF